MSTFIDYHLIQTFAPSNLNRDDTGAPKDAVFGGHRRARISSQCLKRAARLYMRERLRVSGLGVRTRLLHRKIRELIGSSVPEAEIGPRVEALLTELGLGIREEQQQSQYLLFLGEREIEELASVVKDYGENLASGLAQAQDRAGAEKGGSARGKSKTGRLPDDVRRRLEQTLKGGKAVDVALFGRMLADRPEFNVEAACQVAHAISVHRVEREVDYYTAVDDLQTQQETGAGMIGEIEFNAATYYRYATIDWDTLVQNLGQDRDLAVKAVLAFTEAAICAIPTGKQNSFAAHNLPQFVAAAVRDVPLNLATAFETPVWPKQDTPISRLAVERLAEESLKIDRAYGLTGTWGYFDLTGGWAAKHGPGEDCADLRGLKEWLEGQLRRLQG